jgi:hypothetical protein
MVNMVSNKQTIKKLVFMFSAILIAAAAAGAAALIGTKTETGRTYAAVSSDGYFEYLGTTQITVTGLTEAGYTWVQSGGGVLEIPAEINDSPVRSIGPSAFINKDGIAQVLIPNTVTTIEASAFRGCTGLVNLQIPNSIVSIGDYAFYDCAGLPSITIPSGVLTIGVSAFQGCAGASELTIGKDVTSIGNNAFKDCTNVSTLNYNAVQVPSVGSGEYNPFYNLGTGENVDEVTLNIGSTVNKIPNNFICIASAYYDSYYGWRFSNSADYENARPKIRSIIIPDNVTAIGDLAFCAFFGVGSITIGTGALEIDSRAFWYCDWVREFNFNAINATYCSLVRLACNVNSSVFKLTIGNSVTRIPQNFDCDMPLTSVTIPENVTTIADSAFNTSTINEVFIYRATPKYSSITALEGTNVFPTSNSNFRLYVDAENIDAYKAAWPTYVSFIRSLPEQAADARRPNVALSQPQRNIFNTGDFVELTASASVTDGGVLSYQWYKNTVNSNQGGTLIDGATDFIYRPEETPETSFVYYYYYVVVTNTNENVGGTQTAEAASNTVEIIVVRTAAIIGGGNGGNDADNSQFPVIIALCAAVCILALAVAGLVFHSVLRKKEKKIN